MNILQKTKQNPRTTAAIVIVAIVLFWYARKAYLKGKYSTVKYDEKNIPVDSLGNKWNPEPLAREIFENLEGYNLNVYRGTSEKVLQLNDDQTKFLYNYYNRYLTKDYPTLTQLFDNEWNQTQGRYNEVVAKLKALGLN